MRHFCRLVPALLSILVCLSPALCRAQTPPPDDNWVPDATLALGQNATFHTDFMLGPETLRGLSAISGDRDDQHIVAGLRSIGVHIYHYSQPGMYDPAALNAVAAQYRQRGWQHLVAQANHDFVEPERTDLWIRFEGGAVEGMAVLVEKTTNLDLIVVNGTLSPIDLLHLRGHFGIPRFHADKFNPAGPGNASPGDAFQQPRSAQAPPPPPDQESAPANHNPN